MKKSLTILTLVFMSPITHLMAQQALPENNKFQIEIEKSNSEIRMKCDFGCAWKTLKFSANNSRDQAIDEYGMTTLEKQHKHKDETLANFLFTISKSRNQIILKGMEGTAWNSLSFSIKNNQTRKVNQLGMTN